MFKKLDHVQQFDHASQAITEVKQHSKKSVLEWENGLIN